MVNLFCTPLCGGLRRFNGSSGSSCASDGLAVQAQKKTKAVILAGRIITAPRSNRRPVDDGAKYRSLVEQFAREKLGLRGVKSFAAQRLRENALVLQLIRRNVRSRDKLIFWRRLVSTS